MSFMNIEAKMNNNLDLRGKLIPTYEDVKNFMEHFKNDNDARFTGVESSVEQSEVINEYSLYSADPSPPYNKDLLDIMYK